MGTTFYFMVGLAILVAGLILGFVVLWLVFGHKRRGEDKAIGILEQMAFFKGANSINNGTRMR
ncbi:hypothetical protein [Acutalibacter caecimuris]|uniref:hypothetical protein n=1 Tax=Acutalibacter caecimuris TaxID=3093657 RepID=UPI002AC9E3FB|nr:hypothetical protein [Acutalibacter sp. M00118]